MSLPNDGIGDGMVGIKPWRPGYLKVTDFGVTFDGNTNDYTSMMNAISAARDMKLLLTLPSGHALKLWQEP